MTKNMLGGNLIRELRLKKRLTLKQLGELVDTHYVFLSRLERNMEKPSEELIKKLAKTLDYKDNVNILIASFGRLPVEIAKLILEDPSSMVELPAFYKKRKRR